MQLSRENFYGLANLFPKHTGLPFVVWISVRENAGNNVHIKVSATRNSQKESLVSVAIRPRIRMIGDRLSRGDLALLTTWIELNRATIIQYWEGEIDTVDALASLKRTR